MSVARALTLLAVAAALVPTTAHAEERCFTVPWQFEYPYACHDTDYPGCVIYGSLGEEGMFHLGQCPWPWGSGS